MAVAEQHHLAWLFGLVCGVRPGTLAQSRKRPGHYLRWGDITITRNVPSSTKSFTVKVEFRWLKGNRDDPKKMTKRLTLTIRSPNEAEGIPLSIPHRILVILTRRGLLQHHNSFESLLDGDEADIQLKEGAAELPVFLAISAQGTTLLDRPCSSESLTAYLKLRARWMGYPEETTMYSWRRKAGTNVERVAGLAKARKFMSHEPDTTTFEESYDQGLYDFDVVGVALEGTDGKGSTVLEQEA